MSQDLAIRRPDVRLSVHPIERQSTQYLCPSIAFSTDVRSDRRQFRSTYDRKSVCERKVCDKKICNRFYAVEDPVGLNCALFLGVCIGLAGLDVSEFN